MPDSQEFTHEICFKCQENAIIAHTFQESCIQSINLLLNSDPVKSERFENENDLIDDYNIIEYDDNIGYEDTLIEELESEEQEIIEESVIQEEYEYSSKIEAYDMPKQKIKIQFEKMDDGRYKCLECDNTFKTKDILRRHSVRHSNGRNFKCNLCPRAFFFQRDLNFHLKCHQVSEKFLCEHCHNEYSSKSALKKHLLIHSDIRLFECKLCEKKFRTKFALTNHMLIHTKIKPFECSQCHQNFTQKNILIRHMISSHKMNFYECEYCRSEKFEKHKDLKCHWSNCQAFLAMR